MTLGIAVMPVLSLHVRQEYWERKDWRERFEAEIQKVGWRIQTVEPPSPEHPDYVYVLVLER